MAIFAPLNFTSMQLASQTSLPHKNFYTQLQERIKRVSTPIEAHILGEIIEPY